MRKSLCVLLAMVLAMSAFSGCTVQQNPDADDGKLHVVTTIFAPYDFARQVGGDDVSVTMLLRPGCEVHSYEPTPKDIIAIRNADVFVYVGGESDAWVKTVLEGVDNPNLRVVTLMDCVELLDEETVEGMQTEKHDHEADGTEPDEHVWTSPRNAARICQKLSDTFAAADSAHAAAYAQRCGDYVEKLEQLDAEFQDVVAHAARKRWFCRPFPTAVFCRGLWSGLLCCLYRLRGCGRAIGGHGGVSDRQGARGEHPGRVHDRAVERQARRHDLRGHGHEKLEFATCHNVTAQAFADGATYLQLMERNVQALREALN